MVFLLQISMVLTVQSCSRLNLDFCIAPSLQLPENSCDQHCNPALLSANHDTATLSKARMSFRPATPSFLSLPLASSTSQPSQVRATTTGDTTYCFFSPSMFSLIFNSSSLHRPHVALLFAACAPSPHALSLKLVVTSSFATTPQPPHSF